MLRMQQVGVIVSDCATLMVEILKDNARPEAGLVYGGQSNREMKRTLISRALEKYGFN